jgi:hypothetical protein
LIADQEKGAADPAVVRGVLAMRERDRIVSVSFLAMKRRFRNACENLLKTLNTDARAACLAVYVDELFRAGLRGATTEEQVNDELQRLVVAFRYLADKDVSPFYKQHLPSGCWVDAVSAMTSNVKW